MNTCIKLLLLVTQTLVIQNELLSTDTPKNWKEIHIDEVVRMAGQEGKLIMIDFYADWCTPCKWMDETVFNDPEVVEELARNYISKKVNIDDLEGFEIKKRFEVSVLPTILILNTEGKIVERIEKTVTTQELLDVLKLHNIYRNKIKIKHDINTSPARTKEALSEKNLRDTYLRYIEANKSENQNYRLQLGVYHKYEEASLKVEKLRNTFLEPIIVVNDYKEEKVRYKVMMGDFATMDEAESFRKILKKDFKLDAIIN